MTRSRRRKLSRIGGRKHDRMLRVGVPVASTLLAAVPGAWAADTTETGGLQEVIVTAQKRVENLQDVPIAVQVLDTKKLEELRVSGLDDYVKFSPSITYVRGIGQGGNAQPGEAHVYIRGIVSGGDGNHSGSQPSVGTYLDEQPITTIDGTVDVHIYDIARIEVLEGPQGTLYGASSEAGTVRIITNKPDPSKFAAGYQVQGSQISHGSTGWEVDGFVNIPLGTSAAVRLVGFYEKDAGFIDNVAGTNKSACIENGVRTFPTWALDGATSYPALTPCPAPTTLGAGSISNAGFVKNDYNTAITKGGRAALKFNLGDNWSITPTLMAQDTSTEGFFAYDPGMGDLQLAHFGPENSIDSWYQAALTVEGKVSNFDIVYAGAYMKRNPHTLAEYSDYSVFYDRVWDSGFYWTGNHGQYVMPQEFVVGGGYFEKWSHELRVSTPLDKPVHATAGLFIQRQLHNIWQQYSMPGYGYVTPFAAYGVPTGNPNGYALNLSLPGLENAIWLTDEQRVDRDQAAFAEVTWDISQQLSLLGGLRYYKYDNSLQGFYGFSANNPLASSNPGVVTCFAPATVSVKYSPCTNIDKTATGNGTVPKATLTYKFTPEVLVYATYSKGFRPGGANRVGGNTYQPDYLQNYEVGWKTQWFDHRLRWNGALFWEDWKNLQFAYLVPPSINVIANGGTARVKGIESELQWAATSNLMLSGGFTLLDPVLTANICKVAGVTSCPNDVVDNQPFLPPTFPGYGPDPKHPAEQAAFFGPLALSGNNLPVAPKFKSNLVARYTLSSFDWAPFGQAALVYQSKTAQLIALNQAAVVGDLGAYALLDLTAGVNHNGLTLEAFVSNVADKRAQLSKFTETNAGRDNQVYVVPSQPRTIGLRVSQSF